MMEPRHDETKRCSRPGPPLTEERIEEVLEAVEHNKPMWRAMPEWGRIHVERQLPILCIYRRAESHRDLGTDRLTGSEAACLNCFSAAKAAGMGLLNGIVLGSILGTIAWLWEDNIYLGLLVGAALALNTMLSALLGGTVPLVLRSLKVDAALASGPVWCFPRPEFCKRHITPSSRHAKVGLIEQ